MTVSASIHRFKKVEYLEKDGVRWINLYANDGGHVCLFINNVDQIIGLEMALSKAYESLIGKEART